MMNDEEVNECNAALDIVQEQQKKEIEKAKTRKK